jgi:hypothetical protein
MRDGVFQFGQYRGIKIVSPAGFHPDAGPAWAARALSAIPSALRNARPRFCESEVATGKTSEPEAYEITTSSLRSALLQNPRPQFVDALLIPIVRPEYPGSTLAIESDRGTVQISAR